MEKSLNWRAEKNNRKPLELDHTTVVEYWMEHYYSKLFAVALATLGDFHLSQDCVQESLVKALANISQLRDPDKALAWLCSIVRNEARTVLRSSWRRKVRLSSQLIPEKQTDSSAPEALELYEILAGLRKKYREVLVLHYVNGFLLKEVAGILHIRESTCRVRLHRARQELQTLLEKEGYQNEQRS